MKHFRFLTTATLIAFGSFVCAQNVITLDEMQAKKKQQQPQQQKIVKEKVSYNSASDDEAFGTLFLQYNPSNMHVSYNGYSGSTSMTGFSLGYLYSKPISAPLYLEFGAAVQYFFKSEKYEDYYPDYDDYYYGYDEHHSHGGKSHDAKFSMLSVKIPINVMYSFEASDAIAIQPYAGIYGRVNILAQTKIGDQKANHFSKDDMGDDTWNRFQLGLHLGCKARFSQKFTAGIGYYMDLTKITDHTTIRGFDITLGLNL
ncbi:MAG: PorT family protein [Prevotella sp.]|nr:PorT family protein [Prevotella sp.]